MKALLFKEFRLTIHPLFYLVPLLGALIIIPNWVYFVALSYVFFISISNIFATAKSQNDTGFSVMLPVRKSDIVKARVMSVGTMELIFMAVSAVFAVLNILWYKGTNILLEPNLAFFGFGFMMYGIFNLIFFPMFYKTGEKLGMPVIVATLVALLFAAAIEVGCQLIPWLKITMDSIQADTVLWRGGVLLIGIAIFILFSAIGYKISAKRFERIDL